ncbi:MAG: hypothetical protein J6X55_01700 [Victivallales bacterium]|nr:hypothetical protein [Victivallales bacterium]
MEKLWEKCKALEMDEAFMERPAGWDKVQQDSHDLAESLEKRHLRENEFNQAVSKLKDMLMDNSISGLDLRHEYERLQSMELPIPELLTRQVREVLAHKQAAKRHKAVLISSACVAVVVISVAVIAFVVYALGRREMRNQWLAKAEMFSKNSSYDELTVLMEEVKEKDSELYASPEFVGFRNEMDEKLRLIEKKKRDFNAYKATLEDIRRENYRGDSASIIRTLDDAAAVAIDDEQKDYVIRWKNDWLKFSAVQEQEADSVVLPILNGIQTALTGVRINKGAAIADEQKALEKIQNEFDGKLKANAIAGCSQEVRSKYEQLKGRIVSRIGDAQARLGVWQEETEKEKKNKARIEGKLDNLRRDIASALPDLNRYEALLKNFVELGEGTPESTDYRQMLMQFSEYRKVLSLKGLDIEESISDREVVAQVEKLLSTDNPASSSVWQSDLERLKSLNQVNNELRRKAGTLLNVREGIVYVIKCRRHGEKNWTYYYGEKPFQTQQKDGVIYYWGSVLWASPLESRVAPMTLAELNNGANMNSSEYEVVYSRIKDDNLAEHVKVMKRMVLEAMRSDDVQTLVLKELQKLRNNSEVEPVQAMVIFKKFVTLLASYSTVELPECREWAAAAVAIDTNVPWQNANHPKTLAAREAIKAFWAKIPDFETYIKRLQWNRQLLAAVLGTKLRSVGSIQLNGDGHKVYIPRSRGTELWLYQPGGNGLVPGFKLLPMDEAGNVQEKNLAALPVGCLVFAPYQGREIRPLWRRFVAEDAERVKTLIRPQALPMNID